MPTITQARVLATCDQLPAFPDVVLKIQDALEDPDAGLNLICQAVEKDPVVSAQVLAAANRAGHGHGNKPVSDVFTAISLVGIAKVRELTTMVSMSSFIDGWGKDAALRACWARSVSVAVCSVEVVLHTPVSVSLDAALVAGLLHDVGRLWLHRFEALDYADVIRQATAQQVDSATLERARYGVDHAMIGGWMARRWELPACLMNAIEYNTQPWLGSGDALADIVHVAQVLCNALELHDKPTPQVSLLWAPSCEKLDLHWGPETQNLLGRIEARSRHIHAVF